MKCEIEIKESMMTTLFLIRDPGKVELLFPEMRWFMREACLMGKIKRLDSAILDLKFLSGIPTVRFSDIIYSPLPLPD